MNVGIYNPYHDTLGGGEQYMFSFAAYFLKKGHTVTYFTSQSEEIIQAQQRFGFNLSMLNVQPPVFHEGTFIQKLKSTKSLDIFLFYSDGSIPISFAKKTYLVFQFPVPWVNGSTFGTAIKKKKINGFIVNSEFTKTFIDKTFSCNSSVVYPSISMKDYESKNKENYILSVGRFTGGMNTKRHDILIDAFKRICDSGIKDWKLIIAGGVRKEDTQLLSLVNEKVGKYPVEIIPNIEREKLLDFYSHASVYWHAAGYEVDEQTHPELVEHFGITTLEAMASGAIPIVFPAGGQKEIIQELKNGFFWKTTEELSTLTKKIIESPSRYETISSEAITRAREFDRSKFYEKLELILPSHLTR